MSDTPKTDAATMSSDILPVVELARTMERENAALLARLAEVQAEWSKNKEDWAADAKEWAAEFIKTGSATAAKRLA